MAICEMGDCDNPVKAHGLCAKHYMRQRRTGDPETARRPGPAPVVQKAYAHAQAFMGLSERSWYRFKRAANILQELVDDETNKEIIDRCSRSNGDLNVSAYEREADEVLLRHFGYTD